MEVMIIDVTIPRDEWVNERKVGKIDKYKTLKDGIARMRGMKEVIVILVVVGASGAISPGFEKYIAAIGIEMRVEHAQKTQKTVLFIGYSKDFEISTWMLKKSIIISIIVQDSVGPLTTGCCPLSQNQLEQLKRV